MKEKCMNRLLKFSSLRQKDLESTTAAQCFSQIWKQLTDGLHAMKIEDLTECVQVLSLQMKKNVKIINSKCWK